MAKSRRRNIRQFVAKSPELKRRDKEIRGARMLGASINGLARGYGLSPTHVRRIVFGTPVLRVKPTLPRKSRARPWRAIRFLQLKDQARTLRKKGFSYREIAERLDVSHDFAHAAARMVKITCLLGRAWLSHELGRPKEWKRQLRQPETSRKGSP